MFDHKGCLVPTTSNCCLGRSCFKRAWKTFHPVSSSQAISEAIWSVLRQSTDMDAGQAANHSHTAEWMKVMCRHMYNKVSMATPQPRGFLEITVCGLFNHAVLGEVYGSVTGDDLVGRGCRAGWACWSCVHTVRREISIQAIACWQETVRSEEKLARDGFDWMLHGHSAFSIQTLLALLRTFWTLSHWSIAMLTFCMSCSFYICISCDLRFFCAKKTFCSVTSTPNTAAQKLLSRLSMQLR